MTGLEERLLALIDALDDDGIVAMLAPLNEAERAALEPTVGRRVRELKAQDDNALPHSPASGVAQSRLRAAFLAWVGTGDLATLPPVPDGYDRDNMRWHLNRACAGASGHQILLDRRPRWLAELAQQHLEYGHWMWDPVWRLVVDELIERPTTAEFLVGLARYAAFRSDDSLADMVRRDPLLLRHDLPALLDLPTGLDALAAGDQRRSGYSQRAVVRVWSPILAALPAGDALRDRILTDMLGALGGDLEKDTAARHHTFLTALRPTPAEFAARRQTLLRLTGHRLPAIVGVAVSALTIVDKKAGIDPSEVVAYLGPATGASSVTTARAAAKLLSTALGRQPGLAGDAAAALAPALGHRRADVQREAVQALLPFLSERSVAAALANAKTALAPTVAAELAGLTDDPPPRETGVADLVAQAAALLRVREDAELSSALAACRAEAEPPAVVRVAWRHAYRRGAAVSPLTTVDDVIEALLRVIDRKPGTTTVIEQALDGLAALGGERPKDFGLRVGPLVARVNRILAEEPRWGDHYSSDFTFLIANWIEPQRSVAAARGIATPRDWLIGRIREVALMLQRGTRSRLLALPTDDQDWIEPSVLAERAILAGDAALDRPLDVSVAIARLAPWGRAAARERLQDVPGPLAAVLQAVCGAAQEPDATSTPDIVRRAVAWHRGDHTGAPFRFGEPAPLPPVKADMGPADYAQATVTHQPGSVFLDLRSVPAWQARARYYEHQRQVGYGSSWGISQWPGDTDWVWSDPLLSRHELLALLDTEAGLPPVALAAVIEHLGDEEAAVRTLAADVLIQTIADGRLTSVELALTLAAGWSGSTVARVVNALTRVASAGPLHRAVVARALVDTATAWSTLPAKPLYGTLSLLDEAFTADGYGLASAQARAAITPLAAGRSKTARLAARVLAHQPTDRWPSSATAVALAARIERHQRLR